MAKTVLIVDDNEHLRRILSSVLCASGYAIVEAATGTQAIAQATSAKPNLILIDLDLPDMMGTDVARAIKKNAKTGHIPILGCSAYFGWEWREEALSAGMSDYLQKPVSSQLLQEKIAEFILLER